MIPWVEIRTPIARFHHYQMYLLAFILLKLHEKNYISCCNLTTLNIGAACALKSIGISLGRAW